MLSDEYYMAKAIQLAKQGWYSTHPNPRVGCVIVRDEHIIAQAWHQYAGQGHAEVNALAQLSQQNLTAQGATAYVSLEPCSHFGKTPPCSNALIDAGIKRVVVAMLDPNPLVAGQGVTRLKEHGIEVKTQVLESEAQSLNPGFIQRMLSKRPKIRAKMAMSLDGRTAMANGESQWITGADAREDVQRLRAESSAVLTGIGTVLADDPSMNVRSERFAHSRFAHSHSQRQPDRLIVDSRLRMPIDAKILSLSGQTIILTQKDELLAANPERMNKIDALKKANAQIFYLSASSNSKHCSLSDMMPILAQQQYNDVLLEAGATLTGAMLQAGLVDELIIYMAPHIMGSDARGLFNILGLDSMSQRIHLSISDIRAIGDDFRITASPQYG